MKTHPLTQVVLTRIRLLPLAMLSKCTLKREI
jgi:hypothetical protein